MSTETLQTWTYVLGEPHPNQQDYATSYIKPWSYGCTGSGYRLWRSTEERPHTPTQGKEDVYVAVHRLMAVSECYPSDMPIEEILADMDGKDVHHTTGFPSANFGHSPNFDEPGIKVVGHGEHSEITQSQMRAWGEDAKREAKESVETEDDYCPSCLEDSDTLVTSDGFDGKRCLECAKEECGDHAIEL